MQPQNQNNFTHGSQIFAHQLRMLSQGSINALTAGLIFTIVWLMWRTYQKLSLVSLYYFIIERYVWLKRAIGVHFYPIDQL